VSDLGPTCRLPGLALLGAAFSMATLFIVDAHALPRGFREDFNGCATQSPDAADRKRCCTEVYDDCKSKCDTDYPGVENANENISCGASCLIAVDSCKDGKTVRQTATWPGAPEIEVPGLEVRDDHVVPTPGLELVPSRRAVLVELLEKGDATPGACVAFVVACQCPAGAVSKGQECRAGLDGNATACKICGHGAPDKACTPCPDCRPEVLSAQACRAPDLEPRRGPRDTSKAPGKNMTP
jgi:hypothetical protein